MTKALEPHPFAEVFPPLDGEAFDALVKDIEARGQQEPIWVYEDKILDGRNRYRACQIAGHEPVVKEYTGNDPIGFVLSANLHRRHLNEGQRAMIGAKLASLVVGANQHTKELGLSAKAASDLLKVGTASIERAKVILKSGDPELIKDVTTGKVSVAAAAQTAKKRNGKSKTQSSEPENEEDKLAKERQKLSDKIDSLVDNLVGTLKELKALDADNAIAATGDLLNQLKAADLIEEPKRRKAA
jgi:ParB-like chromosome segregation protein Spo0J